MGTALPPDIDQRLGKVVRDILLKCYHVLPTVLRSTVATARGGYLRFWRYGSGTDALRDEALERDHWTTDQWQKWREERLAYLLHRSAARVPYYRDQWAKRRRSGDRASWEHLENWPLLEKETLRLSPRSFLADDRSPSRMFHDHTSGTSGKSLDLWLSRSTVQAWYAIFEARCRQWNGASRGDRWAIFGGQLVTPVEQSSAPFWVWNASLNQLYLSSYHVSRRNVADYIEALRRYRVRYLLGYPSAVHALASAIIRQKLIVPKLEFVLTNAEPVLAQQRSEIEQAFGCPVRETYGMAEIVAGASECAENRMHLWPEIGHVEIRSESSRDQQEGVGELICTGLLNDDMPLIRYRVGDWGALAPSGTKCECGRALPILRSVEGRIDDLLYTPDGRTVGRLDPVFKSRVPLSEAQIIQDHLDLIRVRFVPDPAFSQADRDALISRVRDRMGEVKVVLEEVESIPRGSNGKFRSVICNLSAEERERVAQL